MMKRKADAFLTVDRKPRGTSKSTWSFVMSGEFDNSMSEPAFREMLSDLGFFPDFVQLYALRQHLRLSAKRRASEKFDFTSFLECLCRIVFVHLHFYGNPAQQNSSSKAKCLWLLAALRVRCRDLGPALGLPEDLVGSRRDGSQLWATPPEPDSQLDKIALNRLIFWDAMDANLPAPAFHTEVRPRSRAQRAL
mmetsp:Transcript_99785/g.286632  ORF Transcript_99785/g.286632 Transcript_99785/m.286632 type:complete len:193 (-) Transcript_99785:149-727(-)